MRRKVVEMDENTVEVAKTTPLAHAQRTPVHVAAHASTHMSMRMSERTTIEENCRSRWVWRRLLNSDKDWALVFEDDAALTSAWPRGWPVTPRPHRPCIGIAGGMSTARVWTRRCSKRPPRREVSNGTQRMPHACLCAHDGADECAGCQRGRATCRGSATDRLWAFPSICSPA